VQPLFITIDPARDTAEVLAGYVRAFDPRIVGLRGTPAQTAAAAQGYGVIYERDDEGDGPYLFEHTSYIYVMNPEGRFIEALAGEAEAGKIARRVTELMGGGKAPAD